MLTPRQILLSSVPQVMAIFERVTNLLLLSVAEATAWLKVMAFFFTWTILWLPLAIPVAIAIKWHPPKPLSMGQKLPLLASLYLIAPLIIWGFARLEKVPFSDFGLHWKPSTLISIGLGFGLGVLGLIVLFGIQWALGLISRRSPDSTQQTPSLASVLLPTLFLGLWISGTEELIFRGFLLNELQQDYSVWIAAAISSLIFALLHLVWEVRETIPQLPGLCLMGMVLVLARTCDRGNLGLAIGLHAGWIWGIASLDTLGAIAYTGKAPEWLTGFNAKPLAGGFGILLLFFTATVLWFFKG